VLVPLGRLQMRLGHLDKAEAILERAMEELGGVNRAPVTCLELLGMIALEKRDHAKAVHFFTRGVVRISRDIGPEHHSNASLRSMLGLIYSEIGNQQGAIEYRQQAWSTIERDRDQVYRFASESEQAAFSRTLIENVSDNLAIVVERTDDAAARAFACEVALSSKGAMLESMIRRQSEILGQRDPQVKQLVGQWRMAAAAVYEASMSADPQQRDGGRLAELEQRKENAEQALARVSARFANRRNEWRVRLADVAGVLPEDSALVEFVKYHSHLPRRFTAEEQVQYRRRVAELLNLQPPDYRPERMRSPVVPTRRSAAPG
jgi:tetratricopeptide (TPR) repeat protein